MKFELWRYNFMETVYTLVHVSTDLFLVLNSNFRGLWWSQFKLWRLTFNFRSSSRQKFKFNRLNYIFGNQKYFKLSVHIFTNIKRFLKRKDKICKVFELSRFELVRFYCMCFYFLLRGNI
jgi:hypothetical protein